MKTDKQKGLKGNFNTLFTKLRVNKWNESVSDEDKVVYENNNVILSDWKGKD